ncbi:c-type cytochrome [Neisseria zalophi]|uniref:Cytochrome C n=1 Tax=Neisseria zalophi TaxID=640030 RepID=A0A5J6PRL1_9NEIS|nr:c-type cytochrome [Neisseria zalophi]QEY25341.1 cytochrome C [Neisseria zalophi]
MNKYTILTAAIVGLGLSLSACRDNSSQTFENKVDSYPVVVGKGEDKKVVGEYALPSDSDIDKQPNATQIRYGQRLLNETKRLLPGYVGNQLNCNSCHIAQGKVPGGNPYINTYNSYPREMPRAGKELDLAGRINGCFQRSMNGKPLPEDSEEMQAMIAYMKWLGQDVPKGQRVDVVNAVSINTDLIPNPGRGKQLYAQYCASCHGSNGEGKQDGTGHFAFPPLWGDQSFNIGAGMARTYKAAAFIKAAMPMGVHTKGMWGEGNLLSEQDAVDIAEFFTHQPRPDFAGKVNDWPNGKKPKDARY